jgi:hypothetical protein
MKRFTETTPAAEIEKFLTPARRALLKYVLGGGFYVTGADVRVARALEEAGLVKLEDNGAMLTTWRRSDGERWTCELTDTGHAIAITLEASSPSVDKTVPR